MKKMRLRCIGTWRKENVMNICQGVEWSWGVFPAPHLEVLAFARDAGLHGQATDGFECFCIFTFSDGMLRRAIEGVVGLTISWDCH